MPLPPNLRYGSQTLTQTVLPGIRDGTSTAQGVLENIESGVEPVVNAIVSLPETVASTIGDLDVEVAGVTVNAYTALTGEDWGTEARTRRTLERMMGIDRRYRELNLQEGDNLANQVTIFTQGEPTFGKRNMFSMLAEDGDLYSGTTEVFKPDGSRVEGPNDIFAPFSLYYPSSMWPYSGQDGSRYTVHDFGREPIDSNWLGTKPLAEIAVGRKLDKIGALPGFAYWGDITLGTPPTILWIGTGILAFMTAAFWGPTATGDLLLTTTTSIADLAYSTVKSLKKGISGR